MNLDELISKYIDAELAPDEDSNLREFISESEKARDIFDRSVGIHIAMLEDSKNIMPPKDLVRETESKIMMQIMALKAEPAPAIHKINHGRMRYYQMAAAAVVMFLVGVITISDINFMNKFGLNDLARLSRDDNYLQNYYIDESGEMAPLGDEIQTIGMPRERYIHSATATDNAQPAEMQVPYSQSAELLDYQPSFSAVAPPESPQVVFRGLQPDESGLLSSAYSENGSRAAGTASIISNPSMVQLALSSPSTISNKNDRSYSMGKATIQVPSTWDFDLGPVHSIVNVTSHFGTDIARFGFDNAEGSSVSHFSQAISFGLDEKNFLGVELGYTQYTVSDKMMVKISTDGGSGSHKIEGQNHPKGEIPPQFQVAPKSISNNKQLLWCVGFWEWNFLSTGDFSMDTRIGLGGSADGPLGLTRLMTRYEILRGLYITLGLEGRVFKANMEEMSKTSGTFKSSTSVVYGLQLKF